MGKKSYKNSNGWMLVGQCIQWMTKQDMTINEKNVYTKIVQQSFGQAHRWCYVKYSEFDISSSRSMKKAIDGLCEKKILIYRHTFDKNGHRKFNEYTIQEPIGHINNFIFRDKPNGNKKEEIEEEAPW